MWKQSCFITIFLFSQRISLAFESLDSDFIIAPFSVWSLLLLVAEGAGGNTLTEFQNVLRLPSQLVHIRVAYSDFQNALNVNTRAIDLRTSQLIITDENRPIDIEDQYRLEYVYNTDHLALNFHDVLSTSNTINNHVRAVTRGIIRKIVSPDDLSDAQLLLISAIYFRGQWTVCHFLTKYINILISLHCFCL